MNQDELIEKCRLTDDEILHDCICRYRENASADELIMSAFKGIAEHQLRRAIPIIEAEARKAEREKLYDILNLLNGNRVEEAKELIRQALKGDGNDNS